VINIILREKRAQHVPLGIWNLVCGFGTSMVERSPGTIKPTY
jgi:hypothetical protein